MLGQNLCEQDGGLIGVPDDSTNTTIPTTTAPKLTSVGFPAGGAILGVCFPSVENDLARKHRAHVGRVSPLCAMSPRKGNGQQQGGQKEL